MKKTVVIISSMAVILIIAVILLFSMYSNKSLIQNKDTHFYSGQSDSWFATYSVTKAKSSYYNSLTIQFLFDPDDNKSGTEKIGPIEYLLDVDSMKMESSYPQQLQGVGNFHTGSRMNADMFTLSFDEHAELTVNWQGKSETMKLEAKN